MDPLRTLTPEAYGVAAPALSIGGILGIVNPVGLIGTGSVLSPFEVERQRKRASEEKAKADREAAALEQRAREETARQLEAQRRAERRRTGRASTILASAPLGVTTPIGFAAGGRTTLG